MAFCIRASKVSAYTSFHFSFLWTEIPSQCKSIDSFKVFLLERACSGVSIEYQRQGMYRVFINSDRDTKEMFSLLFPNQVNWSWSEARYELTIKPIE